MKATIAIDGVATNPPWGSAYMRPGHSPAAWTVWPELARVLRPAGWAVLLAPRDTVVGGAFDLLERIPVRVSGALVEILVLRRRLVLAAH